MVSGITTGTIALFYYNEAKRASKDPDSWQGNIEVQRRQLTMQ